MAAVFQQCLEGKETIAKAKYTGTEKPRVRRNADSKHQHEDEEQSDR